MLRKVAAKTLAKRSALAVAHTRITGPLILAGRTFTAPVLFEDCVFEDAVWLDEATAPGVRLIRCELPTFSARSAHIQGDLVIEAKARTIQVAGAHVGGRLELSRTSLDGQPALEAAGVRVGREMLCNDGFEAKGVVNLSGARIDGSVDLTGATLDGLGGNALRGAGMRIGGDLQAHHGFVAQGTVSVDGAEIAGRLDFAGARLAAGEWALSAESVRAGGGVFCSHGFHAEGEVRFVGARIGGPLNLEDAELELADGWALNAWGVVVEMGLWADRLTSRGQIRLTNARVRGPLKLRWVTLTGVVPDTDGISLDLERADTDELTLIFTNEPPGVVNLRGARASQFGDGWGAPDVPRYRTLLGDFNYGSLAGDSGGVQARLDFIAHAEDGFSPGAYDRLAAVFRAAGREEDARDVAIAREHTRRPTLHRARRPVSRFLAATVGYGYRPWRAAGWLAAVVLAGWWVFGSLARGDLEPAADGTERPDLNPLLFSLDAVLPVVKLGQEEHWVAGGAAQWWYAFSVLAGWVLATVLVAALTARLVRD